MRLWVRLWVGAFRQFGCNLLEDMVGPGGLEPLTSSVSRKRSNQLSYGPLAFWGETSEHKQLGPKI